MPDRTSPEVLASHRNLWLVGTATSLVVIAALLAFGPGDGSICLFRAATGVACPGCGMTRAAASLLHGDWAMMWRMHPLAAVIAVEGLVVWVFWGWTVIVRRRRVDEAMLFHLLIINTVLLVVVWLVRLVTQTLPG